MRKIRDLYPTIICKENLYRSAYTASKGRRYRDTTADFNFHLEEEIACLHRELSTDAYHHGKYRVFTIYEPKERRIAAASFRDRVVHHALHDVIEPIIDKTFIYDSYACRKNKGTHKAVDRAQKFLRANAFCFHGDIKKFFPSINHDILKALLRKRIVDRKLLRLLDEIIDSALGIFDAGGRSKGLPIGNLTSQFFANLYLNELDYFIKFDLRRKFYLRYMDDFLILGNDKKELLEIREKTETFLKNRVDLALQEGKSQVYKTTHGIKFLGVRIYRDYRRLTSDNVRRFKKRLKKFACLFENDKMKANEICDSVRCWTAHSKSANTRALRFGIYDGLIKKENCLGALLKDILLEIISPLLISKRAKIDNITHGGSRGL